MQSLYPKLYIENDAGGWADYSSRYTKPRLHSIGTPTHESEGSYQQPTTPKTSITVDNADRHFDRKVPETGVISTFSGRKVKLAVEWNGTEYNYGVFRIPLRRAITTDEGTTAKIELEPLSEKLTRADAGEFKRGSKRYENRPWTFGVRELLRSEYGDSSGALPGSYVIPADPRYAHPDGLKHFTAYGHPPQWDGSSWNDDNAEIPRSIDFDSATGEVFVGIGADLWRYTVDTDTWENLGHDTPASGEKIRALYVCDDLVVVCKWQDVTSIETTTLYVNCYDRVADQWHATTRANYTDFFSGVFWFFDGVYDAGKSRRIRGYYSGTPNTYAGTNVHVPFEQMVSASQSGGGTVRRTQDGSTSPTGLVSDSQISDLSGYVMPRSLYEDSFNHFYGSNANTNALKVRVAYGNKPNLAFDRVDGTPDCKLYMVFGGSTNPTQNIRRLEITRGSAFTATTLILTGYGFEQRKHSLTLSQDKTRLAWIRFQEKTDNSGYDFTQIMTFDLNAIIPGQEVGDISNTLFADQTDMIVDIFYCRAYTVSGANKEDFIFAKSNPERVGVFPSYEVMSYDGVAATFATLDASSAYFVASHGHAAAFPVFYIDAGSGTMKKLVDFTTRAAVVDNGNPPIEAAPFAMDFRYGSGSDPDMWGLSAPSYHPDTQETAPSGKYHLWAYSSMHSGRVPLMDCEGLTKWEAITALADAHHHRAYFDRAGDFIAEPRTPASLGSDELGPDRYAGGYSSLKREGELDVTNFVEITPYIARLEEMKTVLNLRSDSPFRGGVVGSQVDTLERRVHLRCIKGGKVTDGITKWDWRPYVSTVRTLLKTAYTSGGGSIVVESAEDVAIGDSVRVAGQPAREITNIAGTTLTLSSSWSTNLNVLSVVEVYKARDQRWSSQGITQINDAGGISAGDTTIGLDSVADIDVGVYLLIESEEVKVTAVDTVAKTVTVTRGTNAASHADDTPVSAYVRPTALATWYTVGGQRITVKWEGDGIFRVGDFIEFVCPGLRLIEQKEAKVLDQDVSSIKTYGKGQLRYRVDNRFLDRVGAQRKAHDLVLQGATPKRLFAVAMPLLDFTYFLFDSFYVKSEKFFPDETNNRLRVIVRKVAYPNGKRTIYSVEEA